MKYIDSEKLIKAIEEKGLDCSFALKMERLDTLALIDELQQEQPMPNSTELIAKWEEEKDVLKQMDFRGDEWRLAQNAFMDGVGIGLSVKQEQPKGNLEYWLEHFGMPKENIDNCITQIAQGYGACRYLEGIQHGAEAVNELAKQEQPEVDLDAEIAIYLNRNVLNRINNSDIIDGFTTMEAGELARHFYELGLNARKEE